MERNGMANWRVIIVSFWHCIRSLGRVVENQMVGQKRVLRDFCIYCKMCMKKMKKRTDGNKEGILLEDFEPCVLR